MLEWFDWAGDYRWPVRMLVEGGLFFLLPFAGVFSIMRLCDWLRDRKLRKARAADPFSRYLHDQD
jgi:hypothetical protein